MLECPGQPCLAPAVLASLRAARRLWAPGQLRGRSGCGSAAAFSWPAGGPVPSEVRTLLPGGSFGVSSLKATCTQEVVTRDVPGLRPRCPRATPETHFCVSSELCPDGDQQSLTSFYSLWIWEWDPGPGPPAPPAQMPLASHSGGSFHVPLGGSCSQRVLPLQVFFTEAWEGASFFPQTTSVWRRPSGPRPCPWEPGRPGSWRGHLSTPWAPAGLPGVARLGDAAVSRRPGLCSGKGRADPCVCHRD